MCSGFNFQPNHRKHSVACVLGDVTQCHVEEGGRKTSNKRDGKRAGMDARGSFLKTERISVSSGDLLTFLSKNVRHSPTPRKMLMKNGRCAAFAQKQETLNISSVKKGLTLTARYSMGVTNATRPSK